ncbi:MAG: hypothetical protein FWG40_00700 [Peptococcaceae bacterium]|nr:hypothetical protein [Peptococcaceae bacterium]
MLVWESSGMSITAKGEGETYVVCKYMWGTKKGGYGAYVRDETGNAKRLAHGTTLEKAVVACQARENKKAKAKSKANNAAKDEKGEV